MNSELVQCRRYRILSLIVRVTGSNLGGGKNLIRVKKSKNVVHVGFEASGDDKPFLNHPGKEHPKTSSGDLVRKRQETLNLQL